MISNYQFFKNRITNFRCPTAIYWSQEEHRDRNNGWTYLWRRVICQRTCNWLVSSVQRHQWIARSLTKGSSPQILCTLISTSGTPLFLIKWPNCSSGTRVYFHSKRLSLVINVETFASNFDPSLIPIKKFCLILNIDCYIVVSQGNSQERVENRG